MLKRKTYLQVLSVLSCFAVIFLHVNHCFWDFGYEDYWILANFIESIMYFAVPVFFMITGATLLNYRKRYSTKKYFQKRIHKVVIPYVIWSIIGILFMLAYRRIALEDISLKMIVDTFMNGNVVTVYWYFIPLFAVYLSIPVLSSIEENQQQNIFGYMIIISFMTVSLLPLVFKLIDIPYNGSLQFPVGMNHIIFVLIGYYVDHYELSKKQRMMIYVLGILGFLAHWLGTWYASYQIGEVSRLWKGYTNAPSVLYASAIFVFFKYFPNESIMNVLEKVSSYFKNVTFGTYLIHWYIIQMILTILPISQRQVIYRIIGPFVIMIICSMIIKTMQKIPMVKNSVPK